MSNLSPRPTETHIRVVVVAGHELVRQALRVLVSASRDLAVTGVASFTLEQISPDEIRSTDVAVLYYDAGDHIPVISDLHNISPRLRVVTVTERDDIDSQAAAIKYGAVGIVHKEQSPKMLLEAIRQTYAGDTWLNQVVLNKILINERSGGAKGTNSGPSKDLDALTPRELEVTMMIGDGLKNKEIAQRLSITEATVRHHLSSIYGKVGVEDRLNLVITAFQRGLFRISPKNTFPD